MNNYEQLKNIAKYVYSNLSNDKSLKTTNLKIYLHENSIYIISNDYYIYVSFSRLNVIKEKVDIIFIYQNLLDTNDHNVVVELARDITMVFEIVSTFVTHIFSFPNPELVLAMDL